MAESRCLGYNHLGSVLMHTRKDEKNFLYLPKELIEDILLFPNDIIDFDTLIYACGLNSQESLSCKTLFNKLIASSSSISKKTLPKCLQNFFSRMHLAQSAQS